MGKLLNIAIGALTVGYLFFNRNPRRNIPDGENIVSPADGRIQSITKSNQGTTGIPNPTKNGFANPTRNGFKNPSM